MTGTHRSGGRNTGQVDLTEPDGGPTMPSDLPLNVQTKWRELIDQISPDALRQIDVHLLRQLSELLYQADALAMRIRANTDDDKGRRLYLQTCDRVCKLSGLFGMSPIDRQRLKIVETPKEPTAFEQWLQRAGSG